MPHPNEENCYNLNNQNFNLININVNKGLTTSGHYYSIIKDNISKIWYKFDDTHVELFDINNINKEAFGNENVDEYPPKAYILFYEKEDKSNCVFTKV